MEAAETVEIKLMVFSLTRVEVYSPGDDDMVHSKVWVVDGSLVCEGSFNISERAIGSSRKPKPVNKESCVVVNNRELACKLQGEIFAACNQGIHHRDVEPMTKGFVTSSGGHTTTTKSATKPHGCYTLGDKARFLQYFERYQCLMPPGSSANQLLSQAVSYFRQFPIYSTLRENTAKEWVREPKQIWDSVFETCGGVVLDLDAGIETSSPPEPDPE